MGKKFINFIFITFVIGLIFLMAYNLVIKPKFTDKNTPVESKPALSKDTDDQLSETTDVVEVVEEIIPLETALVFLRSGRKIEGEIKSKDNKKLELVIGNITTNISWRSMRTNSIAKYNPTLFVDLLAKYNKKQAKKEKQKEREKSEMQAKGLVEYDGKWMKKSDMLSKKYRFVDQRVFLGETGTTFVTEKDGSSGGRLSRRQHGFVKISLTGLEAADSYNLKVEYKELQKSRGFGGNSSQYKTNNISHKRILNGKKDYHIELKMPECTQYKSSRSSNVKYGYIIHKSMVYVWLDNELIYSKDFRGMGKYHIIDSF